MNPTQRVYSHYVLALIRARCLNSTAYSITTNTCALAVAENAECQLIAGNCAMADGDKRPGRLVFLLL